jgi:UPF0716 protein FxsA
MGLRLWAAIWPIIALAFPLLEIVGIYQIWQALGVWTLAWLVLAGALGIALIAAERVAFLPRLAEAMLTGSHPLELLFASGQRFLAGILFILPGALSDIVALLLLMRAGWSPAVPRSSGRTSRPDQAEVIEGEFRRMD